MSNGYGVYTKVTHFQIACTISCSIPGLCAINVKSGPIHLRGAHHLPLPTLCVGLHPMAQENYRRAQLTGFHASQMKNSQVSTRPTHCLKPFSPGRKCWSCMGWDGVLISSIVAAAFWSQYICNSLVEISCRYGLSSCMTLTQVPLDPWGEYGQQGLIRKEDIFATDFVTSLLTSAFSATPKNRKNAFRKVKVLLNLGRSTRILINSLFQ